MPTYGTCDEYSRLRTVILCPPVNFEIKTPINAVQAKWHQLGEGPDPAKRMELTKPHAKLNRKQISVTITRGMMSDEILK